MPACINQQEPIITILTKSIYNEMQTAYIHICSSSNYYPSRPFKSVTPTELAWYNATSYLQMEKCNISNSRH